MSETSGKGIYSQGLTLSIDDPKLISWLIEASLRARFNGSAAIKDLLDSTSLFPFRLSPMSAHHLITMSGCLDVMRHGLDQDLIILREATQLAAK